MTITSTTSTTFNQIAPAITHIDQDKREWRTPRGDYWTYQVFSPEGEMIVDCGTVYRKIGDPSPGVLLKAANPAAMLQRETLREGAVPLAESKFTYSGSEGWSVRRTFWADPSRLPDRIWAFWQERDEFAREGWYITSYCQRYRLRETALHDAGFFTPNKNPKDGEVGMLIRKSSLSLSNSDCPPCRVVSRP